ncbi:MAG: HAMP domain-containing histidine kinase [Gomphosphaeria aponina SAG 52.96 = DSM 107014]|uniref:histidine kinase n=1 Tax=Gomphosphaeria aponina SAG 52.96 = DSM 107014 TaxID=1521640 RepID=A0A941GPB8_9CHRO|nr:HAMP domain-containing histidine kinase [Gomphosphaeria aponina SAG 52.96 = DSM 107014]
MFQTTRRRLAIWYTTVTAVLLLLFASGVYFYVRHTLIERIDDTLKHVVEIVDRSLVIEEVTPEEGTYQVKIEASFRHKAEAVEDDHIDIEWFSPSGELLWSTFTEPLAIPLNIHPTGKTVYLSSARLLRQVTKKIEFGRYILGYLRVSHPWFEVTKPIKKLIIDLTIGISMMVICVGAIGWLLSGIAIKPVRDSYQSLKQFTADASHELRNPIAMIQTNIQMALAYPEADPKIQERQLKVVERLTQRLGNLVNDLLFLARSDSGTMQINYLPVPLDALLIEVIEEQRLIAEQKGIFLSLHIVTPNNHKLTEDIFTVRGDWDQLARLFTNLISNALEHSKIGEKEQETGVEVELQLSKKEQLQVKIKDQGSGISEEALPHIFDRFYRVDPARSHSTAKGTGLGLAIAKAIADKHHGNISVESVLNVGTTFTVTLPLNPTPAH